MTAMKLDLKENGSCIQNVSREFNNLQVYLEPQCGPDIMIFAAVTSSMPLCYDMPMGLIQKSLKDE